MPQSSARPTPHRLDQLGRMRRWVGQEGISQWCIITQHVVDEYARLTGDGEGEWVHLDPVRAAAELPYGGTIVPGFLQVSHLIKLGAQALDGLGAFDINHALNYGFDRLRFVKPLPVGVKVRVRLRVAEVVERPSGGYSVKQDVTLEMEDGSPTLVAEWLFFLTPRAFDLEVPGEPS